MRIGCLEVCSCFSACYEWTKQALTATILTLDKIRSDPEAFQNTCLIALAIIRGFNFHYNTNYFSRFANVLEGTSSFDFYGCFRLPYEFLHPYSPERLDEYAILDGLEVILCDNWHLGIPDETDQNRDPEVRQFAQEQLNAFLQKMVDDRMDFQSEKEVRMILHHWLEKSLEADPEKNFDPHDINLQDLVISLKDSSWIEVSITTTFMIVDLVCVPSFFQEWNLIDLAPYAEAIGNLPLLSWVANQSLDDWIWGMMGLGSFLQFIDAACSLWKGEMTLNEAKDAKWLMVVSIAKCVYSLVIIQKRDLRLINCLALISKSLGLLAFLLISKPTFFNNG